MNTQRYSERCFACGKPLKQPHEVWTEDPQIQWVGPECYRKVLKSGTDGYQPPKGGPRLFSFNPSKDRQ